MRRGLCLSCLLSEGLGTDSHNGETLEDVLAEIDVRDADWRLGNYQILEEIERDEIDDELRYLCSALAAAK